MIYHLYRNMSQLSKYVSFSWSNFPIAKEILASLEDQNFERPLPIQVRAFKASLLDNKHVLGAAQTGSGKTLAYAIPTLNRILNDPDHPASLLKRRICEVHRKKEDFELVDQDNVSIEETIVDRISDVEAEFSDSNASMKSGSIDGSEHSEDYSTPEAIILVPTRELAFQVKGEFDKLCKFTNLRTCCLVGGLSQDKQLRMLKRRPEIIIATPGRLYDIVESDSIDHLNVHSIASIKTLVIDEADRMVQKGHFKEMLKIIDIVKDSKVHRTEDSLFRVYLYSATLTFLHELPDRFNLGAFASRESRSKGIKKDKHKKELISTEHNKRNKIKQMLNLLGIDKADTRVIDLNNEASFGRPDSEQLIELKINCLAQEKDLYLYYFLSKNQNKRILVFVNSKDGLRRLSNVLKYLRVSTLKLHADMEQKKRLSSLEQFRKRTDIVLVATDVAARGLDIKELDCVVHYQVPKTCESYIHRSGRTARLHNIGTSLTLCEPKEIPFYKRLCNNINGGKDLHDYDINTKLKQKFKGRVNLAQQCDKLDHQLRESRSDRNWYVKAAKNCDIELDEDEIRHLSGRGKSQEQNLEEDAKKRRLLSQLQKQLNMMLKNSLIK